MLEDRAIVARARKVIVSNWFDVSLLRIRVSRGVISIQGHIQKISGGPEEREGNESTLRKLDTELRAIPSTRGTHYELDNWTHDASGTWRKKGGRQQAEPEQRLPAEPPPKPKQNK